MTDNKLTDNEIKKALECCVSEQYTCEQCPYQEIKHYDDDNGFEIMPNGKQYDDWSCERWLNVDLLDLINRLQAEIEHIDNESSALLADIDFRENEINRLQAENERLFLENQKLLSVMLWGNKKDKKNLLKQIKAEAYKEFAEKLLSELYGIPQHHFTFKQVAYTTDKLLKEKELVGDK